MPITLLGRRRRKALGGTPKKGRCLKWSKGRTRCLRRAKSALGRSRRRR